MGTKVAVLCRDDGKVALELQRANGEAHGLPMSSTEARTLAKLLTDAANRVDALFSKTPGHG